MGYLENLDKQLFLLLNGSDSLVMDGFAMTETSHFAWILFVLAIFYLILKSNNLQKSLLIFCILALLYLLSDTVVASFFQPMFARLRPGMDLTFVHMVDSVKGTTGGIHCMISNQASKLMAITLFLSLVFRSMRFFGVSLCWTLLHSYILLYLGYYFPSDILFGFIWGALVAVGSYFLYFKINNKFFTSRSLKSDQSTSSGYLYVDILFVECVALFNLIGIIIMSFINN